MDGLGAIGRLLILVGLMLAGFGLLFVLAGKVPWLGRLPGDIAVEGKRFTFYFPVVTCIVISVVLTLLVWLIQFLKRS